MSITLEGSSGGRCKRQNRHETRSRCKCRGKRENSKIETLYLHDMWAQLEQNMGVHDALAACF